MRELHDELAVETVDRLTQLLPLRNEIIAMDGGVASDDSPFHQHRHEGRDDGAGATFGELAFPIDPRLGERAVLVVESPRDARAEDAVFHLEVIELQRREDHVGVVNLAHAPPLLENCGATPSTE